MCIDCNAPPPADGDAQRICYCVEIDGYAGGALNTTYGDHAHAAAP